MMRSGGDLRVANLTVSQAEVWCNTTKACVGFTLRKAAMDDDESAAHTRAHTHAA